MEISHAPELPREKGVTFFKPEEKVVIKNNSFQSKPIRIGDLGYAYLAGEKDAYALEPYAIAYGIVDGVWQMDIAEIFEEKGYFDTSVHIFDTPGKENITVKMKGPGSTSVLHSKVLTEDDEHPLDSTKTSFRGSNDPWEITNDEMVRHYSFYTLPDADALSKIEFFFQVNSPSDLQEQS